MPGQIEPGRQGGAQVDAVERLELVTDPADPAGVVERAGRRAGHPRRLAWHVLRRTDDARQQLVAVGVRRQRDPRPSLHRRPCEVDAPGGDVRAAEIERRHEAGHATNAFTTLQSAPRRRLNRYEPTDAGTTMVSA